MGNIGDHNRQTLQKATYKNNSHTNVGNVYTYTQNIQNTTPPISNLTVNRDSYTCELQHVLTKQASSSIVHAFGPTAIRRGAPLPAQLGACPGPTKDIEGLGLDFLTVLTAVL